MSGIVIDVESLNSKKAEDDLRVLNTRLLDIIKSSSKVDLDKVLGLKSSPERALDGVKKSVEAVGTAASTTFSAMDNGANNVIKTSNTLRNAIVGIGTAFLALKGTNAFTQAGDDLTQLQNKLKLVTDSSYELMKVQRQVYQVSKDTRSSLASNVGLYVDFAKSLESSGIAQEKVLGVIKTIQQSAKLSGASIQSVEAALMQMTQGIASGVIRGEEFNSIMEQMQYLGAGLRTSLGLNAGQLRKFAEEGRLTTDVFIKALEGMQKQTDKDFSKTSATISDGLSSIGSAVNYAMGELNTYLGVSSTIAGRLVRVSKAIEVGSSSTLESLISARRKLKNYLLDFQNLSDLEIVAKSMISFEVMPWDAVEKYKAVAKMRERIEWLNKMAGTSDDIKAKISTPSLLFPNNNGPGSPRSFNDALKVSKDLLVAIYDAGAVTIKNLVHLFPTLRGPVQTLSSDIEQWYNTLKATSSAKVFETLIPALRKLEAASEFLTGYSLADNELERAWVNLFRSKDIVTFTDNLKELNNVRKGIKFDDSMFAASEGARDFVATVVRPIEDALINIGLLDNRILKVQNSSFDRTIKYLDNAKRVITRLYTDLLAPKLEPVVASVLLSLKGAADALLSGISDTFDISFGKTIGSSVGRQIRKEFTKAFNILFAEDNFNFDKQFNNLFNAFNPSTFSKLTNALASLGKFAYGVAIGFWDGFVKSAKEINLGDVAKSVLSDFILEFKQEQTLVFKLWSTIAKKAFAVKINYALDFDPSLLLEAQNFISSMFLKINEDTVKGLVKVELRVRKFAENIKDLFFDIYDKVVGHSYWPDMIDGVVKYTDNVFKSNKTLDKFSEYVSSVFTTMYDNVINKTGSFGSLVQKLVSTAKDVNWGDALLKFTTGLGASIVASWALAFDNPKIKLVGIAYLVSIFGEAIQAAATVIGPSLFGFIGETAGVLTKHIIDGSVKALDIAIGTIPKILEGAISQIIPSFSVIADISSFLPIVAAGLALITGSSNAAISGLIGLSAALDNNLTYALAAGLAGIALFTKNGTKALSKFFSGDTLKGTEGLFSFIGKAIGGDTLKDGISKINFNGAGKDLAIALGILSTSALESVSFGNAAMFATPLLLRAFLGDKGGSETLGLILNASETLFSKLGDFLRGKISAFAAHNPAILDMLASKTELTNKSPIAVALTEVIDSAKPLIATLKKNLAEVREGVRSIKDVFKGAALNTQLDLFDNNTLGEQFDLFGGATNKVKTDGERFKDSLKSLFKEIGDLKFGNTTVGAVGSKAAEMLGALKDAFAPSKVKETLVSGFKAASDSIKSTLSNIKEFTTDTFSAALSLLKNKYVLFAALFVGGISSAFAYSATVSNAVDSFMSSMNNAALIAGVVIGGSLALSMVKAFASVYVTSKSAYIDKAFKALNDEFAAKAEAAAAAIQKEYAIRKFKSNIHFDIQEKSAADQLIAKGVSPEDAASRANSLYSKVRAIRIAELEAERDAAKLASAEILSAQLAAAKQAVSGTRAGFEGLYDYIKGFGARAKDALLNVPALIMSVVNSPIESLKKVATAVGAFTSFKAITDLATSSVKRLTEAQLRLSAAFKSQSITETIVGVASAVKGLVAGLAGLSAATAIQTLIAAFSTLGTALKGGIITSISAIISGLAKLARWIVKVVGTPLLIATGVAAAVGTLGLWLFGPGDSFVSNLEWAYDKIKSLFGLAPTTGTGRAIEFAQTLAPKDFGGASFDVSNAIASVDFSKLSEKQSMLLSEFSTQSAESLKQLETYYFRTGYLTKQQQDELNKISVETEMLLARMPQKASNALDATFVDLTKSIENLDNSLWGMIKRYLGIKPQNRDSVDYAALGSTSFADSARTALFKVTDGYSERIIDSNVALFNRLKEESGYFIKFMSQDLDTAVEGSFMRAFSDAGRALTMGALGFAINGLAEAFTQKVDEFTRTYADTPTFGNAFRRDTLLASSQGFRDNKDVLDSATIKMLNTENQLLADLNRAYMALDKQKSKGAISEEEYTKRQIELSKKVLDQQERVLAINKAISDYAIEEKAVRKFNDKVKFDSAKIKDALNIDIGADGTSFLGSDKQLRELSDFADRANQAKFKMGRKFSYFDRAKAKVELDGIQAEASRKFAEINADARVFTSLDNLSKVSGIEATVIDLQRLKATSADSFEAFKNNSSALAAVNTEMANTSSYEKYLLLQARANALIMEQTRLLSTGVNLESINKGLQAAGLGQITQLQFTSISKDNLEGLAGNLTSVKLAALNLKQVIEDPTGRPFSAQIDAIKLLRGEILRTDSLLKGSISQAANDAMTETNPILRALKVSGATGVDLPKVAMESQAGTAAWAKLQTTKVGNDAVMAEFKRRADAGLAFTESGTFSQENFRRIITSNNDIEESLSRLEERFKVTFDSMLSSASKIGIEISDKMFSHLPDDARQYIVKAGVKIEEINHKISYLKANKGSTAQYEKLIAERMAIEKALSQTLNANVLTKSKEGSIGVLDYLGLGDAKIVSADFEKAKNLFDEKRSLLTKDIKSPAEFIQWTADKADLEAKIQRFVEQVKLTFEGKFSALGNYLGISSDIGNYLVAGLDALIPAFKDKADTLKSILDNTFKGTDAERKTFLVKQLEEKLQAKFQQNVLDSVASERNLRISGAGASNDLVRQSAGALPEILQRGLGTDRAFVEQLRVFSSLKQIASGPLDANGVRIIDKLSQGVSPGSVLDELQKSAGRPLGAPASLSQLQSDSIGNGLNQVLLDKLAASTDFVKSGIDARTFFSGSKSQQSQLASLGFAQTQLSIAEAATTDPVMLGAIQVAKANYAELAQNIVDGINNARNVALEFANGFSSDINNAFKSALMGKADENKSVFETFLDTLLNSFTSKVISAFTDGLMDPLTGKDGILTKGFKEFGASLFSGGGSLFSGLGGLFGGSASGPSSEALALFGFADGGFVSGPGTATSDSIPSMLSNGEYVVNAKQTRKFLPVIHAINSGNFGRFADGGLVSPTSINLPQAAIGSMNTKTTNQQVINVNITGDISRQTQAEIYKMLPNIAVGVNQHNANRNVKV